MRSPAFAPAIQLFDWLRYGGELRRDELVLITGHPRSGTHFTGKLLRALGYTASIEGRWISGTTRFVSSWKHAQPGEFRNRFYARPLRQDFNRILHQVRHPLDVIASSATLENRTVNHIKKYVDIPQPPASPKQPLALCMRSWLGWNRLIEARADWRFQLEEMVVNFPSFCRHAGLPAHDWPNLGAQNRRSHGSLTWDDLEREDAELASAVRAMARRYGYPV